MMGMCKAQLQLRRTGSAALPCLAYGPLTQLLT